jgi:SAM-dependent methyltransferase
MCLSCLSWYGQCIAPRVVHVGCSAKAFSRMRQRMVPMAKGAVVEVGFGSGLNLPYYDTAKVRRLIGVDPDGTMLALAKRQNRALPFELEYLQACGESMPLADSFADTVVVAYALCTIPQPGAALAEIRRVLKPGGRLIFLEHGQANGGWRRRLQDRFNRFWGVLAGGCNLNRNPFQLVASARFDIRDARQEGFPPTFWLLGSHYAGVAIRQPSQPRMST